MEKLLQDREYITGQFSFVDSAYYVAQFFAARHTVPLSLAHPNFGAWRERMINQPPAEAGEYGNAGFSAQQGKMAPELGNRRG